MKIKIYDTKVRIISKNKNLNKNIDCFNCIGLIIDYSEENDFYTVEFEYSNLNGEIETDIAFLKTNDFVIIDN